MKLCAAQTQKSILMAQSNVFSAHGDHLLTSLAHQLDKTYVTMQAERLGKHYRHRQSMWFLRKPSDLVQEGSMVPSRLPENCYHPNFLNSLSEEGSQTMNIQPPIDLASIMARLVH